MKVNTICEILYEVKAKTIIKALVERQQKVENKTLGKRLAEVKAMAALALETEALVDTVAYGVEEVDVQTLCYTLAEIAAETLIHTYTLADRLPVVEEEKVGNTQAKVECKVAP